jgi:hypothetical protein
MFVKPEPVKCRNSQEQHQWNFIRTIQELLYKKLSG